jgi:hypothetical protein
MGAIQIVARNGKNIYLCANQTNKKLYDMTKEEFLSIAEGYYPEFESIKEASNFYDYEKLFVDLWQKIGKEFMEKQLNESSSTQDRRKKKLLPDMERFQC